MSSLQVTINEDTPVRTTLKFFASIIGAVIGVSVMVATAYTVMSFRIETAEGRLNALEKRDVIWEQERLANIEFRAQVRAALHIKAEKE